MKLINNELFYVKSSITYPPFKNGLYLEEYFLKYMTDNNKTHDNKNRLYIPALWTNFQIEGWFNNEKQNMQNSLDNYIKENPSENGYFTIIQHDDGSLLNLPENTIIYGACSGNIQIPLIYEDKNNTLNNQIKKKYNEKKILSSFVGTNTHFVRNICINKLSNLSDFHFIIKNNWSVDVEENLQQKFIENTINSKFALAPRGYGRSSFRFFEILKLGTIPIYVWDDIEWLPYKDIIDYKKLCISINISEIDNLPNILNEIDEIKYNDMIQYYNNIKENFELNYIVKYIMEDLEKISLCIPTMDRFDSFLSIYLDKYIEYLKQNLIDEIIINDENGNDYKKIQNKYKNIIKNNSKFKIFKNENRLGVFKNKLKVCSFASNKYIALIDSDNFANDEYFTNIKNYINNNKENLSKNFILSLCKLIDKNNNAIFNYENIKDKIIKKENIKENFHDIQVLLNTGNYIISKNIIDNIKFDDSSLEIISAYDVYYFNLLAFQQFPDFELHVLDDLKYLHCVHSGSIYSHRDSRSDSYLDNVLKKQYCELFIDNEKTSELNDFYKETVYLNDNFIKGWSTYYYGVFSKIINDNNFKIVAEVGIGYGCHAKQILKNTNIDYIYLIDPIKEYPNDAFSNDIMSKEAIIPGNNFNELHDLIINELKPWQDKYTLFRKPSLTINQQEISDGSLDCVFIDGANDYNNVYMDLEFWWKKIKIGGHLLGDDYWMNDVKKAVNNFSIKNNIKFDLLNKDNNSEYKIYHIIKK